MMQHDHATDIRKGSRKAKEAWLIFTLDGKEIAAYSIKGTFSGELEATKDLLAFENHCPKEEIKVKGVMR